MKKGKRMITVNEKARIGEFWEMFQGALLVKMNKRGLRKLVIIAGGPAKIIKKNSNITKLD